MQGIAFDLLKFFGEHDLDHIMTTSSDTAEWTLAGAKLQTVRLEFPPLPLVEVILTIQRSPQYHVICLIIPMNAILVMTSLVYWIPPSSGEKMSFLVSNFVSVTMFLNFLGGILPRNFREPPKLALVLIYVLVENVVAMLISTAVMTVYQSEIQTDDVTKVLPVGADVQKDEETGRKETGGMAWMKGWPMSRKIDIICFFRFFVTSLILLSILYVDE